MKRAYILLLSALLLTGCTESADSGAEQSQQQTEQIATGTTTANEQSAGT